MMILSAAFFKIKVSKNYKNYELCYCPYHSDGTPSSVFLKNDGVFFCYGCKTRKTILQLAEDFDIDFDFSLFGSADNSLMNIDLLPSNNQSKRIYESFVLFDKAVKYLVEERGVDLENGLEYELEWSDLDEAIVFPMNDYYGNRVGNVKRVTKSGVETRYIIDGEKTPVWPLCKMKDLSDKQLIVSEGPFKAMIVYQISKLIGWDVCSVSIMGSSSSSFGKAIGVLKQNNQLPFYIVDNDTAGVKVGEKMRNSGLRCFKPSIPFDEMSKEDAIEVLKYIREKGNILL